MAIEWSGELSALAAALLWTLSSGLWRSLSGQASAVQLNAIKNSLATLFFLPVLIRIPWLDHPSAIAALLISGVIGIALGDSLYLAALRRIGTRRTLTIEAAGPVLASLGSLLMQGDSLTVMDFGGAVLVTWAVLLIANRATSTSSALPVDIHGILLALGSVISGLSGAFLARGVLIQGEYSALDSAAIRLLGGMVVLLPIWWRRQSLPRLVTFDGQGRVLLATLLGTNVGILLQQMVFRTLAVGPGVTLMSTAPLMALAIARMRGQQLGTYEIAAGVFGVAGVALTSF